MSFTRKVRGLGEETGGNSESVMRTSTNYSIMSKTDLTMSMGVEKVLESDE